MITSFCLRARSRSARKHTPVLAFGGWSSDWSIKAEHQFFLRCPAWKCGGWCLRFFACLGSHARSKEFLAWVAWATCACVKRELPGSVKRGWVRGRSDQTNHWSRKGGEWSGQAGLAKRNRHQGKRERVGLYSCIVQACCVFKLKILSLI